ncbi:MAG: cytochrome c [Bacteroidota bacterium]
MSNPNFSSPSLLQWYVEFIKWVIAAIFLMVTLFTIHQISTSLPDATEAEEVIDVVIWYGTSPPSDLAIEGKKLFKDNCATCHNRDMRTDLTGPALGGIQERWIDYSEADLRRWILNSQAMIEEGHPRAVELFQAWKPIIMPSFNFTDQELDAILAYIDYQSL